MSVRERGEGFAACKANPRRFCKQDGKADGLVNMSNAVSDNPALNRFELPVEGHTAFTEYAKAPGVITFVHTDVPPELGGKGIGSKLIKGALDQVRADGLKVVAQCPFVKAWIDKHPEYADLLKS